MSALEIDGGTENGDIHPVTERMEDEIRSAKEEVVSEVGPGDDSELPKEEEKLRVTELSVKGVALGPDGDAQCVDRRKSELVNGEPELVNGEPELSMDKSLREERKPETDQLVKGGSVTDQQGPGQSAKEDELANEKVELGVNHIHLAKESTESKGYLNCDMWHWVVGYLVDDLRIFREFPLYPDVRDKVASLHTEFDETDPADVRGRYAHKIYGYLTPPQPGLYKFKVELTEMTAAGSMELWVSMDSDPCNSIKVLDLLHDINCEDRSKTPIAEDKESKEILLESDVHYFELLEKAFDGKIVADVKWKLPSSDEYVDIPSDSFSIAFDVNDSHEEVVPAFLKEKSFPSNALQTHHPIKPVTDDLYPVTDLDVLPSCEFSALYAQPHTAKTYEGHDKVVESKVFPKDESSFKRTKEEDRGNHVIDTATKDKVVSLYTKALEASQKVKGEVVGLHYLEETPNKEDGSRFLLEMDVQLLEPRRELVHTSEYVYLKSGSDQLCHTSNFQWRKNVEVYFVVSVKNLGLWVKHLIYNMEDIYEKTGDEHFSLVMVDFASEDMNIEEEIKKSSFKRIHVVNKEGAFTRSGGLQAGVDYVKNNDSIVMTIDLHLTLPVGTLEYVRKHVVQHKMAYTPMFFRLDKGYTEINCYGSWEIFTYGLFAMYKSDWVTFGGFNTEKYGTKWGGEDWDVLDRALAEGFEVFRIRPPGLVHYHHTRKGMWGNEDIKFTKKWTLPQH